MSELVRMMARLMLVLFAVCAALMAGICVVGRLLPPKQVLALEVRNDNDGTLKIVLVDTEQNKQATYLKLPFQGFVYAWALDGKFAIFTKSDVDGNAALFIAERNGIVKQIAEKLNWRNRLILSRDGRTALEFDDNLIPTLHFVGQDKTLHKLSDRLVRDASPVWSSDGRFAYLTNEVGGIHLYLLTEDDSLYLAANFPFPPGALGPNLFWSPDGRLAFRSDYQRVNILARDGNLQSVTIKDGSLALTGWSPDGKLTAIFYDNGAESIVTIGQDGVIHKLYTTMASLYQITWSPDGRLAFIAAHDDVNELRLLEADGTIHTLAQYAPQITGGFPSFSWSPDGRLAYIPKLDGNQTETVILERNGQARPILTGGIYSVNDSDWSVDGRLIFASSLPDNTGPELHILERDGSLHNLTVNSGSYHWIDWPFD